METRSLMHAASALRDLFVVQLADDADDHRAEERRQQPDVELLVLNTVAARVLRNTLHLYQNKITTIWGQPKTGMSRFF